MSIKLSFNLSDVKLSDEQIAHLLNNDAVEPDEMYFQYLCVTTDGTHDPNGVPDENVRPSHAALHGTIWRVDDPLAPVPPIDWGCRCGMRYVSAPETALAKLIEPVNKELKTLPENFTAWLDKNTKGWEAIAKRAAKEKPELRLGTIYNELKERGDKGDLRDIARMIYQAGVL